MSSSVQAANANGEPESLDIPWPSQCAPDSGGQTGMPKTETQTSTSLLSINCRGEYYDDGSDYSRSQALDKAKRNVSCKHIEAIFSVEEV